jgi:hypothetical protein
MLFDSLSAVEINDSNPQRGGTRSSISRDDPVPSVLPP